MFRIQLIYFFLLILLAGCSDSSSEDNTRNLFEKQLKLKGYPNIIAVKLTVLPREQQIHSEINGKIERIHSIKKVRKNQTILRLDNKVAFLNYGNDFATLQLNLKKGLDNFPTDLSSLEPKWQTFYNQLKLTDAPPEFPKLQYKEEQTFSEEFQIKSAYIDLVKSYLAMDHYFLTAKSTGFVYDWQVHTGENIEKNQVIAQFFPADFKIIYSAASDFTPEMTRTILEEFNKQKLQISDVKNYKNKMEAHVYLNEITDKNKIPFNITIGTNGYLFLIPDKYVKKDSVAFYNTPNRNNIHRMKVEKQNAHYTVQLTDSLIYLVQ